MTITVYGVPKPQGSKRYVGHSKKDHAIMIESCKELPNWREAVKWAAIGQFKGERPVLPGALRVRMVFTLPRPAAAKKRAYPHTKPDLSKLVRATEDALTDAGVWEDDARVVGTLSEKRYVGALLPLCGFNSFEMLDRPGCVITIEAA